MQWKCGQGSSNPADPIGLQYLQLKQLTEAVSSDCCLLGYCSPSAGLAHLLEQRLSSNNAQKLLIPVSAKSDAWRIISPAYVLGLAYWLRRNQGDVLKWSSPLCTVLVKRGLAENSWVFHQFSFPYTTCCKSRSGRWSVLPLIHTFHPVASKMQHGMWELIFPTLVTSYGTKSQGLIRISLQLV